MALLARKRLGEILVEAKKLKEEELHKALAEQRKYGEKLGNVLIRMGLLSEKEIMETVSKQLGIPIVNLFDANLSEELVRLIPENMAKNHMVIPFERNFSVLRLAMIDPLDINALDEVARFLRMEVAPCIVTRSEMKWALERYYGIKSLVEETLDSIKEREALSGDDEEEEEEKPPVEMAEDEPVIKFVNSLLAQALADNASDIHIEPAEDVMRIRMRVDGRLREMQAPTEEDASPYYLKGEDHGRDGYRKNENPAGRKIRHNKRGRSQGLHVPHHVGREGGDEAPRQECCLVRHR